MKMNQYTLKMAVAALFLSSYSFAQTTESEIINSYLGRSKSVKISNAATFKILNVQNDKALNGKVVHINQTFNGIPVYGAISSVLIKSDEVSYISNNFVAADLEKNKTVDKKPSYNVRANFSTILSSVGLKSDTTRYTFETKKHNTVLSQLAYLPKDDQSLQLVYALNFYEDGTNNYWNVLVDAQNGTLLNKSNLTLSCDFSDAAYSHDHASSFDLLDSKKTESPIVSSKIANSATENASYRIFPFPIEAPTFGSRSLVSNPWWTDASPLGWHNDGNAAYTITRGNNTYAYADETGYNTPSAIADGGVNRLFDFPFGGSTDPATYKNASITNLFYVSNKMHDIFYRFGFDEEGRNFQSNNFGKGEAYTDTDPVLSESRDGGGYNNANFSTPPDGYAPRMQMYLWQIRNYLSYNTPADLSPREPMTGINSDFGKPLTAIPITTDVVLATPLDACTSLNNTNLTGKIALIQRGTCYFDEKFKNAQNKGAVAVIIYNADPAQVVGDMVGTGITVSIPGVSVNNEEGVLIKEKLDANISVNVSLQIKNTLLDGSMDNGVIAHEYGHGISTRSTGNGYTCLDSSYANEQMGEGWSDFFALMVTNSEDATAAHPRGMGTYVNKEDTTGAGIRPAKYSPDFSINSYTYGDTNGMAYDNGDGTYTLAVHPIGFVWATMLWDLHWKFAEKYGFSNDIANNKDSGSAKVMQLVTSALKIQGCYPSFVKGRDAIIAADQSINNGENKCMIWETFAKRGLGFNAKPGKTAGSGNTILSSISDQVEDFSIPLACQNLSTQNNLIEDSGVVLHPNPAKNEFFISVKKSANSEKVMVSIYDITGKKVSEQLTNISTESVDTTNLTDGVYIIKGEGIGISFSKKLIVKK